MGLLHSPRGGGGLAGRFRGELLPGSLPSGGLAGGLLRTSHLPQKFFAEEIRRGCINRESGGSLRRS